MIDFYIDDRKAEHALLKAIWDNKDKVSFTFFRESYRKNCKITLDLGKYSIRAIVPIIGDSYIVFHVYKRKMLGLYKSDLGCMVVGSPYVDSLEARVSNYIDAKVTELRKAVDETEEAERRKVNAEFIDYIKENYFISD